VQHQCEVGPCFCLLPAGLAKLSGQLIQQRAAAQPGQWAAEQLVLQVLVFCQRLGHSPQGFWPELEVAVQGWQAPGAEVAALHGRDWGGVLRRAKRGAYG